MSEPRMGKKPDVEHCLGKPEPEAGEVQGRAKPRFFTCWNDAAGNYITSTAFTAYFTCWRCGTVNWVS